MRDQKLASPIRFGTSGWRAVIADDFTFANVRLAVTAIAGHVRSRNANATVIVGHDMRFLSEDFARAAAHILAQHGIRVLLCEAAAPTPAIAFEIRRCKAAGAINFTASHNPAPYHGLKFSGPDGGPALPEVTRDIEARAARLATRGSIPASDHFNDRLERISPREPYLKRLAELVRFDLIRKASLMIVCDALHGCGAGYLDRALAEHGISTVALRLGRDVLFDGAGPDVSAENLAPLKRAVLQHKTHVGLATDGDADRFGILDSDGTWVSPNHVLALVYDYLVETRGWKLPAARSVATSHLLDAVAHQCGAEIFETPVGFKYIGELIQQDKIALGGEESAGLSIRGHVPEKDGILACLLVAEMIASRGQSLAQQIQALFRRVGRAYWPLRSNLHLEEEVKARLVKRLKEDYATLFGRRVKKLIRTDGLKLEFDGGSWLLLRLSGTEPLVRLYTEADSPEASARLAEEAKSWILGAAASGTHHRA